MHIIASKYKKETSGRQHSAPGMEHFEYRVMPLGLTNAPATFQIYIHEASRDLLDLVCMVYLDDIVIFSKDKTLHKKHLQQVRTTATCSTVCQTVKILSMCMRLNFLVSKSTKKESSWTVREFGWSKNGQHHQPTTFQEVQVFLSFCNFYRRFVSGYSRIAQPLTSLMKRSVNGKKPGKVDLHGDAYTTFDTLKKAFQNPPLLRHWDPTKPLWNIFDSTADRQDGVCFSCRMILLSSISLDVSNPADAPSRRPDYESEMPENHDLLPV